MRAGRQARWVTAVLVASLVAPGGMSAAGGATPPESTPGDGTQVVSGELFDPASLPSGGALSARAIHNRAVVASVPERPHPSGPRAGSTGEVVGRADSGGRAPNTTAGKVGATVASVASGISVLHTQSHLPNFDTTGGMVGGKVVYGTYDRILADPHLPTGLGEIKIWENATFFALPGGEYYFGSTVSASIYRGRWVAAMPSFIGPDDDCTTGYMNIAVSTTTDPLKPWTRYRISMGDAWSDSIRLGVSDNKVVLATNRWDLDSGESDCLGLPYEGARLRVVDWDDLLNGGTLTSRDVSPTTNTNYFNFVPATNIPTSSVTTSSTTVYIAGEKFAGGSWGKVVLAAVTGSAKSGSAALTRNEDLTTSGAVPTLTLPPDTIAAFPSGNGGQDERIQSATWRGGRLWLSATGSCTFLGDTAPRACARFVNLNTTVTPATNLESAYFSDIERDTFLPLVGFARDGGAYFTMAASSAVAHEPIDQLATFRASGQPILGGADEVKILAGASAWNTEYFGSTGSVMAVPNDSGAVLAAYSGNAISHNDQLVTGTWTTQLRGGQTANPGGSYFRVGNGSGFTSQTITSVVLRPLSTSPINAFRYSASPDVESTAGGPRLVNGRDLPSLSSFYDDFADPDLGGTPSPSSITVYGQWQTWDGTWSTPIGSTLVVDTVAPVVTGPTLAFTTGTIGTNAPIKLTWSASDALSGLDFVQYQETRLTPHPNLQFFADLAATTTSYVRPLHLGSTWRYELGLAVLDRAENATNHPFEVTLASVPSSVNMTFAKTWHTSSSSKYLGGSTRYATAAGATVTYSFSGRAIAWLSTKGSNRGKAEVWVDGVKKATIDLQSSSTKYRQEVFQASWTSVGNHTIMVKVLGTSGRPRVDFDSFLKAY